MKKITLTIALLCAFCISAHAERAVTNLTIEAQGTTVTNVPLNLLVGATTYADLDSLYYSVTNGAQATVAFLTRINGIDAPLFSFNAFGSGPVSSCRELSPRRTVTSNQNPDTTKFRLFGTNTILRITQTVATTNDWTFDILFVKD